MGNPTGKTGKPATPSTPPPGPAASSRRPAPKRNLLQSMPRSTLILWLVAMGLVFLFVPLVLINNAIRTDTQRLNADLDSALNQLNTVPTPAPAVQQLSAQLTDVQSQTQQIAAANQQLNVARPNWPGIMAAIAQYDPVLVQIESLTSGDNRVTLSGRAVDQNVVVNYARTLEQSTLFNRVNVQSIRVLATPVVTRTPTITPSVSLTGTATLTATLDPRDLFEPDNSDALARPIAIGVPQVHNFYPSLDVDVATFLAKSGRFYRITTADLAPGVDTFLSVSVGDKAYVNDDAKAGTLASEVTFQNTGADALVIIRTTNRAQYGADKRYQLIAEELVPTLTPTPGPSPTPTHTPTPTPTPTLPPDLRDTFEPDETAPRPIIIAQPQLHNFYPDSDFDQVEFLAKAGRFYRVYTTDLAPAVDTFLTLVVGVSTYTNDDAKPGTLASEITFSVTGSDVIASARITNRGQYGPDKRYQIILEEFLPTPTVPVPNTPTPIVTPGVTPVPTQDLRDAYEPDELVAAPIAVNGSQARNFYPGSDVDQIMFPVKLNHFYTVQTSNLALGVDTVITTTLDGSAFTNDDYEGAPIGAYASMLCITSTVDGLAVARIVNNGLLFGPGQTYTVTVNEVAAPPVPCSPAAFLQIVPSSSSLGSARSSLGASRLPINVVRLVPTIGWPPTPDRSLARSRALIAQQPTPEFYGVEFVIIVELKVGAP
ncbi:MAG: PilN domain-containing protein [Chloroflexi bacterium]|nr:PilN domain-containing protein [Chloroflexota bacterium]